MNLLRAISAFVLGTTLLLGITCLGAEIFEKDVSYSNSGARCSLDIYSPNGGKGLPTLIWLHGGGLTGGNKYLPAGFKQNDLIVVSPNYRLMPGVPIEACLEDAAASLAWVLRNIESRGGDLKRVYIGGHSAGAYLATMIATDSRWMDKQGFPGFKVAGAMAISGQMVTHFALREQRGMPATQVVCDDLAPFFHIKAGLPPMLLVTGDRELELYGRYEENAYYARMLRLAGNKQVRLYELGGYNHGAMVVPAEALVVSAIHRFME